MAEPTETQTIREEAALPWMGTKMLGATDQSGELPAFKVGGRWRSRRGELGVRIAVLIGYTNGRSEAERGGR